jgi:dTDP-4-amino-4,6-dideoxygalactose transaminase
LDELQAALLRVMLRRLAPAIEVRRKLAETYLEGLSGIPSLELPTVIEDCEPAWHQFVVRHPRRDALAAGLAREGVETAVHYATLPPFNTAFTDAGLRPGAFPVAERHASSALSLPINPDLSDADARRVIDAVRTVAAQCSR